jgi:hypothetical protein
MSNKYYTITTTTIYYNNTSYYYIIIIIAVSNITSQPTVRATSTLSTLSKFLAFHLSHIHSLLYIIAPVFHNALNSDFAPGPNCLWFYKIFQRNQKVNAILP